MLNNNSNTLVQMSNWCTGERRDMHVFLSSWHLLMLHWKHTSLITLGACSSSFWHIFMYCAHMSPSIPLGTPKEATWVQAFCLGTQTQWPRQHLNWRPFDQDTKPKLLNHRALWIHDCIKIIILYVAIIYNLIHNYSVVREKFWILTWI